MSEDNERLDGLVAQAAGIIAYGGGKVKIAHAMRLVGFTSPEIRHGTTYQRVRRAAPKVAKQNQPDPPKGRKKKAPADDEANTPESDQSDIMDLNITQESNDLSSLTKSGSSRSRTSPEEEVSVRRPLFSATSSSTTTVATGKKSRASSKQVQRKHALKNKQSYQESVALKQATVLIKRNKALPRNHPEKKTQVEIVRAVNKRLNTNVSAKTAATYFRNGWIGRSPIKRGPKGEFEPRVWKSLKGAYVTYIKLEQAECKKQSSITQLSKILNGCVNKAGFKKTRDDFARKLQKETAHLLEVGKANVVEHRRLLWTTSYNLEVWFKTFKATMIDLGFARPLTDEEEEDGLIEGSLFFFDGMKDRIGNLDETDGSLDDTTGQRGGRPPMTFYSPEIRGGATAANKTGYSATVICGSTAAGDPFPPHFQLKTTAQTDAGQRLSVDWFVHTKNVVGKWGFRTRTTRPCTFGMNEKAGMNAVELEKYLKNSILPLYPDIQDFPGKRVVLKVDSGPGRNNIQMLADLRLLGLYLVPGVPNTTHVTQETDQNYGLYKSVVRGNLRELSQARFDNKETMHTTDLPLVVFGGHCALTGVVLRDAFSEAFSIQRNLSCWRKCGAVPLTMAPLFAGEVRQEVPVGAAATIASASEEDEGIALLKSIEEMNAFYCDCLCANGFDGDLLRKKAPTRQHFVAVTVPHSKERLETLKKVKGAGGHFYATGGEHLNTDDVFRSKTLLERDTKIAALEARKALVNERLAIEESATLLLQTKGNPSFERERDFTLKELKLLIKWKKVKPTSQKKADLIEAVINNPPPLDEAPWTVEEEMLLVTLKESTTDVDMKDTALGVQATQMAHAVLNNFDILDDETKALLLQKATAGGHGVQSGLL